MFRTAVLTLLFVTSSAAAYAIDWRDIAKKTSESIVYVETTKGSCTGFVIDSNAKGNTDRVLTAAHCDGEKLFVDYVPARVIWKHVKDDLMVVEIENTGRPALSIAKTNPVIGEEIASYGYGYALERPTFRVAHVSDDKAKLPELTGGPFVMIDAAYVSGQSGGPCVNAAGEVVSIVQYASNLVGVGVGAETIADKAGRFFEKPKP